MSVRQQSDMQVTAVYIVPTHKFSWNNIFLSIAWMRKLTYNFYMSFICPPREVDVKFIEEQRDLKASKRYLDLDHLGRVLKAISSRLPGIFSRTSQQCSWVYFMMLCSLFRCCVCTEDIQLWSVEDWAT